MRVVLAKTTQNMMTIKIKNTNIVHNQLLRSFIDKKVKSLNKFLPKDFDAVVEVEVGRTTKHHKTGDIFRAEIQIQVPGGKMLRGVSERESIQASVVEAKGELEVQFDKYKEKLATGIRRRKLSKVKEKESGEE